MSSAGRCIACSTASGTLVGPGIARNSRPARTTIVVFLIFVARLSEAKSGRCHAARKNPGVAALARATGFLRGREQRGKPLSSGLAAAGRLGIVDRAEPARALGDVHLDFRVPAAGRPVIDAFARAVDIALDGAIG